jgi:hypothetical protein
VKSGAIGGEAARSAVKLPRRCAHSTTIGV